MTDAAPSPAPVSTRRQLGVLIGTVLVLAGASWLWYELRLTRRAHWLQPGFMLLGTLAYLGLLRWLVGRRWRDLSRRARVVIVSSLLLFAVFWLVGRAGFFNRHLLRYFAPGPLKGLYGFLYFSVCSVALRLVAPLVMGRRALGLRAAELGFGRGGGLRGAWIYALLFVAVALVVVFYASTQASFQHRYPMCRRLIRGGTLPLWQFAVYQLAYGAIFVSGESFWRGYIAFGLERSLGRLGLVFMIIPYTMAHFGKPLPETLGAIVAGLVLGLLALRHRSFWPGVVVHWGVALVMDVSALLRRGIELV